MCDNLRDRLTHAEPTERYHTALRTLSEVSTVLSDEAPQRWGVTASVTQRHEGGYVSTRQIAYFEINANVQGCLTREQAHNTAYGIIADILGVPRWTLVDVGSDIRAHVAVEEVAA